MSDKMIGETTSDVFESMTEDQKNVLYYLVGKAWADGEHSGKIKEAGRIRRGLRKVLKENNIDEDVKKAIFQVF